MIDTNVEVGFYTDCFGNEITEYKQMSRYTVIYEGYLFDGDSDGLNKHDCDRWEDAISLYNFYGDMIIIRDNEYDLTFAKGEWF